MAAATMATPSSRLDLNPTNGPAATITSSAGHHHIGTQHSFDDNVDDATAFITRAAANLLTGSLAGYSTSANYDGLSTLGGDENGNHFSGSSGVSRGGDDGDKIAGVMVAAAAASTTTQHSNGSVVEILSHIDDGTQPNNYWALLALVLVVGTAAGNILVCLAITRERRLQNITNYFLMSLAITDLMVAILVMPLGILTLVKGYFPLQSEYCLVWICLDVLFCTASIMHLCTISIDRYLSLSYPMRFGRNKTRTRITVKITIVWLLSIAMSLPLSLMYSQNHASVLVNGTCQIPDPVYKLVGSIVCFYIPLGVMLITYCLTVRTLAKQRQNLGGNQQSNGGWGSSWLGQAPSLERRCTWRRFLKSSLPSTPSHAHSATSTDTELSNLDTHELWLPESSLNDPTPSAMTALHQFGAEMLKLSRGLESVTVPTVPLVPTLIVPPVKPSIATIDHQLAAISGPAATHPAKPRKRRASHNACPLIRPPSSSPARPAAADPPTPAATRKRFNSLPRDLHTFRYHGHHHTDDTINRDDDYCIEASPVLLTTGPPKPPRHMHMMRRSSALSTNNQINNNNHSHQPPRQPATGTFDLPPPCKCPYFGEISTHNTHKPCHVKIIPTSRSFTADVARVVTTHTTTVTPEITVSRPAVFATTASCSIGGGGPIISSSISSITCTTAAATSTNTLFALCTAAASSSTTTSANGLQRATPPSATSSAASTPRRDASGSVRPTCVVTWDTSRRSQRRGSSFGGARTSLLVAAATGPLGGSGSTVGGGGGVGRSAVHHHSVSPLRRSATLRNHNNIMNCGGGGDMNAGGGAIKTTASASAGNLLSTASTPCLLQRTTTIRSHHSRNSSINSRNSARHGRILRLEQKATKVLGVVFFTFVILWAPFFVLNLLPSLCQSCESQMAPWVFDFVTWLGYASSMVNPIFYTIFNKVFRQAFKKVLMCQYSKSNGWRPQR